MAIYLWNKKGWFVYFSLTFLYLWHHEYRIKPLQIHLYVLYLGDSGHDEGKWEKLANRNVTWLSEFLFLEFKIREGIMFARYFWKSKIECEKLKSQAIASLAVTQIFVKVL